MPHLNLTRSQQLFEEAARLIPGGSQTTSKRPACYLPGGFPIFIERGRGCRVWDVDGNEYIDYIGALGPITLGYAYPAVNRAVAAQLRDCSISALLHPLEVEAARAVCEAVPCAEMVRFLKTGAEATAAAVRIARAYTGRELVVSSGYHGWLDLWTAQRPAPADRGVPRALKRLVTGFRFGATSGPESLGAVLRRHRGKVACIVMEPVTYADPDCGGFLQYCRDQADEHQAPLVFDEIVTGFRLALGGAQEHFGVTPDLACFAKGISNGFPVSAVAGRREIMAPAADLLISSTYGGEVLSLAAVVAALREYREKDALRHIRQQGERLMAGLNRAANRAGLALAWRGFPQMSMFAFHYDDPQENEDLMSLLLLEMAREGVLLRRGGLMFINYSHKARHIDQTIAAAGRVFPRLAAARRQGNIGRLLPAGEVSAGIRRF